MSFYFEGGCIKNPYTLRFILPSRESRELGLDLGEDKYKIINDT
jgi:hypothetical protein